MFSCNGYIEEREGFGGIDWDEVDVSSEQVAAEGYGLSVSRYIDESPPPEAVDPGKLESEALKGFLEHEKCIF